ncbi:MAG: hypothetical protein ACLGJC_14105 [Alphaproteobacteria bacterium]
MSDRTSTLEFSSSHRPTRGVVCAAGLMAVLTASDAAAQTRGDFAGLDFSFRFPAGSHLLTLCLLVAALVIGAYTLYRIVLHRSVVAGIHPSAVRNGLVLLMSALFVLAVRYWAIVPMGNGWVSLFTVLITGLTLLLLVVRKVAPSLGGVALIAALVTALAEFTGMLR